MRGVSICRCVEVSIVSDASRMGCDDQSCRRGINYQLAAATAATAVVVVVVVVVMMVVVGVVMDQ